MCPEKEKTPGAATTIDRLVHKNTFPPGKETSEKCVYAETLEQIARAILARGYYLQGRSGAFLETEYGGHKDTRQTELLQSTCPITAHLAEMWLNQTNTERPPKLSPPLDKVWNTLEKVRRVAMGELLTQSSTIFNLHIMLADLDFQTNMPPDELAEITGSYNTDQVRLEMRSPRNNPGLKPSLFVSLTQDGVYTLARATISQDGDPNDRRSGKCASNYDNARWEATIEEQTSRVVFTPIAETMPEVTVNQAGIRQPIYVSPDLTDIGTDNVDHHATLPLRAIRQTAAVGGIWGNVHELQDIARMARQTGYRVSMKAAETAEVETASALTLDPGWTLASLLPDEIVQELPTEIKNHSAFAGRQVAGLGAIEMFPCLKPVFCTGGVYDQEKVNRVMHKVLNLQHASLSDTLNFGQIINCLPEEAEITKGKTESYLPPAVWAHRLCKVPVGGLVTRRTNCDTTFAQADTALKWISLSGQEVVDGIVVPHPDYGTGYFLTTLFDLARNCRQEPCLGREISVEIAEIEAYIRKQKERKIAEIQEMAAAAA